MATVWDTITSEAKKFGVNIGVLSPIILQESTGKYTADNGQGYYGLLQESPYSGQGTGHSKSELLDPVTNLEIGLPPILKAQQKAFELGLDPNSLAFINYIASHSGHESTTGIGETQATLSGIDNYFQMPQHGASMLQSIASQSPAPAQGQGSFQIGPVVIPSPGGIFGQGQLGIENNPVTGIVSDAGTVASAVGKGITDPKGTVGTGINTVTGTDSNSVNPISNLASDIASGLEAPVQDFKAYIFNHAIETMVLVLGVILLISGALHSFEGFTPVGQLAKRATA